MILVTVNRVEKLRSVVRREVLSGLFIVQDYFVLWFESLDRSGVVLLLVSF